MCPSMISDATDTSYVIIEVAETANRARHVVANIII